MHDFEGPVSIVCPEHHAHFQAIGGGGKLDRQPYKLLMMMVVTASMATSHFQGGVVGIWVMRRTMMMIMVGLASLSSRPINLKLTSGAATT
jgi:hypothetical protein